MRSYFDNLLALESHSDQAWAWFIALNIVFFVFWIVVAPRLRAIIRQWLQWDEEFWRRLSEYYGALGGPSVIQRNLVPELSIILYACIAADLFWIFKNPMIPGLFTFISVDCLILWKGEAVAGWVVSRIMRSKPRQLTPEERAELGPVEFNPPT